MSSYVIHRLTASNIGDTLLDRFDRTQPVTKVYRGDHGAKTLVDLVHTERWTEDDLRETSAELREIAARGGGVFVAADPPFPDPLGFAAVGPDPLGPDGGYRQLIALHVTASARRLGIGTALFRRCADFARPIGATRLYISSQSSAETVAFYRAMGCVDARWLYDAQVAAEPCDCQFEFGL